MEHRVVPHWVRDMKNCGNEMHLIAVVKYFKPNEKVLRSPVWNVELKYNVRWFYGVNCLFPKALFLGYFQQ